MKAVGRERDGYRDKLYHFCKLYAESERQFIEFNNIIPNEQRVCIKDVYSPRLLPILQTVCNEIDGVFKFLVDLLELKPQPKKFEFIFSELNTQGMLSFQKVALKESREVYIPFDFQGNVPVWWNAYNDTKHHLPEGAYSATIGNTISALGGLLILLHTTRILINNADSKKIMDAKHWHDIEGTFRDSYRRLRYSLATNTDFSNANRNYFYSKTRIFRSELFYYLSYCEGTLTDSMYAKE